MIAVAAFNIVATLVMTVNSKRPDIAVLRVSGHGPGAGVSDLYRSRCHDRCYWRLGGLVLGLLVAYNVPDILLSLRIRLDLFCLPPMPTSFLVCPANRV